MESPEERIVRLRAQKTARQQRYRAKHADEVRAKQRAYYAQRYHADPAFRAYRIERTKLSKARRILAQNQVEAATELPA